MHCTRRLTIIAAGLGLSALTLGACGGSTGSANAPGTTNAATPSTIEPTAQARLATCDDVGNLAADYSAAASDTSGGQDSKVGADAQKLASDASATGDQAVIDDVNKALAAGRSADVPALTTSASWVVRPRRTSCSTRRRALLSRRQDRPETRAATPQATATTRTGCSTCTPAP